METTLMFAKILGVYLIISGLFILFRGKTLVALIHDMMEHRATTFLAGVVIIFLGGTMAFYDSSASSLSTLIKFVGWLAIIKGGIYILAPGMLLKMKFYRARNFQVMAGLIIAIVGLLLFQV